MAWPGRFLRGRITYALYQRMGTLSAVATTSDDYVSLAVRLATDSDFRLSVRQAIAETCDVLFENAQDVNAWEDMLYQMTR